MAASLGASQPSVPTEQEIKLLGWDFLEREINRVGDCRGRVFLRRAALDWGSACACAPSQERAVRLGLTATSSARSIARRPLGRR